MCQIIALSVQSALRHNGHNFIIDWRGDAWHHHSYQHFLDSKFLSVPSLLIAIGAIIFFIAFFGCCGAARENYCMIVTFTSLLVIVFILELAGGISGYVLRARASSIIEGKMEQTMKEYQTTEGITEIWDNLQRKFDCCGTKNATDWSDILNPSSNSTVKNLPISCCDFKMGTVGTVNCTLTTPTLHQKGCYKSFLAYIAAHAMQIGGVGIGIAIVQAIGIWFSSYLARSIKNTYESV